MGLSPLMGMALFASVSCGTVQSPTEQQVRVMDSNEVVPTTPLAAADHLSDLGEVLVREGDEIWSGTVADHELLGSYPTWSSKGALSDGRRVTLLVARRSHRVGEEVRILHVVETLRPGDELYAMGPKAICGEYVDDELRTTPCPTGGDPLGMPFIYDGLVLPAPAVDANYDVSIYRFSTPGVHRVQWRPGILHSNVIEIDVVP